MEKKNDEEITEQPLMNQFESKNSSLFSPMVFGIFALVVILGIGSGYVLAKNGGQVGVGNLKVSTSAGNSVSKGTIVGSDDTKTFKDTAEGKLETGGIEGEGQFHLVRPGGESQYVYLTSSIVDLSAFVGKKIKVNGQTNSAKKAGWLMDVGRVEVLE